MQENKLYKTRILFLIGSILFVGTVVIIKLFFIQVVDANEYKDKAKRQYIAPAVSSFDRGNIYFTAKSGNTIAAATIIDGYKLSINPGLINNPEGTYQSLSKIIDIDKETFLNKASKENDPYEEIKDRVPQDQANKIIELNLKGVSMSRERWRFYPGDDLAAKVIGFVSYNKNSKLAGNTGLENFYEEVLSRDENELYVNFFAQIFANMKTNVYKNDLGTGDIITSIEPSVQSELEEKVKEIQKKWNSESVGGVIMDPNTGEIIAMANVPTFNLNEYGSVKNPSIYNNPIVQGRYELGSIVKPLVVAGAIDSGAVSPNTTYNDTGSVTINGVTLSNFDKKGRGIASVQDVLNQSLNTGMIFIEQKMGKEKFKDFIVNQYKLGDKTNIDLPAEVNGSVSGLNGQNDINYAAASFGQGIATSPINIVRGFAALANGGYLITPHVATTVIQKNGDMKNIEFEKSTPILKPETTSTIKNMLIKVVDEGYHLGLEHYSVAAKTGTAQIARPDGQGYYTDRNLHSFIGFFPAINPRFVLYLYNLHPKGVKYAIQSLGGYFFDIVKFMNNYYEIPPDR